MQQDTSHIARAEQPDPMSGGEILAGLRRQRTTELLRGLPAVDGSEPEEPDPPLYAQLQASGVIARAERPRQFLGAAAMPMSDPSAATSGGIAIWKAAGSLAAFAGVGAFLAALVAMCMMTPRSPKEWAVGLISTVVSSLAGGAYALIKLGMLQNLPADPATLYATLLAALGVVFACGLPGWAIVRAVFTWLEKRRALDIAELAADARKVLP